MCRRASEARQYGWHSGNCSTPGDTTIVTPSSAIVLFACLFGLLRMGDRSLMWRCERTAEGRMRAISLTDTRGSGVGVVLFCLGCFFPLYRQAPGAAIASCLHVARVTPECHTSMRRFPPPRSECPGWATISGRLLLLLLARVFLLFALCFSFLFCSFLWRVPIGGFFYCFFFLFFG